MSKFDHLNVLTLIGVCLDGGPAPYIIMPFMAHGNLLAYLRNNREILVVSNDNENEEDVSRPESICWNTAVFPTAMCRDEFI